MATLLDFGEVDRAQTKSYHLNVPAFQLLVAQDLHYICKMDMSGKPKGPCVPIPVQSPTMDDSGSHILESLGVRMMPSAVRGHLGIVLEGSEHFLAALSCQFSLSWSYVSSG